LLTARSYLERIDEVEIFCDNYRYPKVQKLADELVPNNFRVNIVSCDRVDTHPNSSIKYQTNTSLPETLNSTKFKLLKSLLELEFKEG
jgi:hypothetical protein